MNGSILQLSDRGQVTIPKEVREQIPEKRFICIIHDNKIILSPLQTREEFLDELDAAEKDWEENGGHTFEEVMEESHKLP